MDHSRTRCTIPKSEAKSALLAFKMLEFAFLLSLAIKKVRIELCTPSFYHLRKPREVPLCTRLLGNRANEVRLNLRNIAFGSTDRRRKVGLKVIPILMAIAGIQRRKIGLLRAQCDRKLARQSLDFSEARRCITYRLPSFVDQLFANGSRQQAKLPFVVPAKFVKLCLEIFYRRLRNA